MLKCCGNEALVAVMCWMAQGRSKAEPVQTSRNGNFSAVLTSPSEAAGETAASYSPSTLAAKIKSLSVSPSILWVKTVSPTLPQLRLISG